MALANNKFYGLSQYKGPFNYELSGKHFHIIMDDGREWSFNFLDGENLEWAEKGKPYVWDTYEAMKGDDTTFLVHIRPTFGGGLINWNFVLDTAQSLVTMVVMQEETDPDWPKLIHIEPFFGAIKVPGRDLPKIRHHLSDRMVGHGIYWYYNPGMSLQHLYRTPSNIRANSGPGVDVVADLKKQLEVTEDPVERKAIEDRIYHFEERAATYPMFDEPCFHIWINDHLNLFCFVEENQLYHHPRHEGGGGILLLQEIERLVDVGLVFNKNEYYMVTAYGVEETRHDPMNDLESPYDWSKLKAVATLGRPVEHDE